MQPLSSSGIARRPSFESPFSMATPSWITDFLSKDLRADNSFNKEQLCPRKAISEAKQAIMEPYHKMVVDYITHNRTKLIPILQDYADYFLVPRTIVDQLLGDEDEETSFPIPLPLTCAPSSPGDILPSLPIRLGKLATLLGDEFLTTQQEKLAALSVSDGDVKSFVDVFNTHPLERDNWRQVAISMVQKSLKLVSENEGILPTVKGHNFCSARQSLGALLACEDPIILRTTLEALIDIFQADPITPESFVFLTDTIQLLYEMISLDNTKNYNIIILRLLIQAYAQGMMTLRLQSSSNSSIIPKALKDSLWDKAVEFKKQIIPDPSSPPTTPGTAFASKAQDPAIKFWISFAVEAAKGLSTEVSEMDEMFERIGHGCVAVSHLIGMVSHTASKAAGGPDVGEEVSGDSVKLVIDEFKQAFYHLSKKEEWFEPMLAFQYTTQIVRYYPDFLDEMVKMAFQYKSQNKDSNLFFGMISALEHLLLNTHDSATTEQAFKILMTNLFCDDDTLKQRIIHTLLRIYSEGDECISATAECLLTLVYQTLTPLRPLIDMGSFTATRARVDALNDAERQLLMHCLGLYIRRAINIQTESGLSRDSLFAHIARSQTGDIDGDGSDRIQDVLTALAQILPNPLKPDVDGNTILHHCVMWGNLNLIPMIVSTFGDLVDRDALNKEGKTALMLCVAPFYFPLLEAIPLLAAIGVDPSVRGRDGRTFWHDLVHTTKAKAVEEVLSITSWKKPLRLDVRDFLSMTPLMQCLRSGSTVPPPEFIEKARLLVLHGANIHLPDRNNVTPLEVAINWGLDTFIQGIPKGVLAQETKESSSLTLAAKSNKPTILDFLLSQNFERPFFQTEILLIFRSAILHFKSTAPELIRVIFKHYEKNEKFRLACQAAIPGLTWSASETEIHFFCNGKTISAEELANAMKGLPCSHDASLLLNMNEAMQACLHSSTTSVETLYSIIRANPKLIVERNVLGRNCLQLSIIEGHPQVQELILSFQRQDFSTGDFRGNTPAHYAAATLNPVAYFKILSRRGNYLATNHLDLIPMVLALTLPIGMLPDQASSYIPYKHIHPPSSASEDPYPALHSQFCDILTITLRHEKALLASLGSHGEPPVTLETYRSNYGWCLLHYAAVYGHPLQVFEISKRLPNLLFQKHGPHGKVPIEQAIFHDRIDNALAMIHGWLESTTIRDPLKKISELNTRLAQRGVDLACLLCELPQTTSVNPIDILQKLHKEADVLNVAPTVAMFNGATLLTSHPWGSTQTITHSELVSPSASRVVLSKPIATAIRKGQLQILQLLDDEVGQRQLIEGVDETGNSAIMLAASYRQPACLEYLLNLAAKKNVCKKALRARNSFGRSALHILCSTHRTNAIDEIMQSRQDAGHSISVLDASKELSTQMNGCLSLFFTHEADFGQTDESGNNSVHLMSAYNHAEAISFLVSLLKEKYNAVNFRRQLQKLFGGLNDDQRTPIFFCVANSSLEAFHTLQEIASTHTITLGQNNRDVFEFGLMHIAAQEGNLTLCKLLAEQGVSPTQVDSLGETPAHKAALNRHEAVLAFLLTLTNSSKTQPAGDLLGMTALHKVILQPLLQRRILRTKLAQYKSTAKDGLLAPLILDKQKQTCELQLAILQDANTTGTFTSPPAFIHPASQKTSPDALYFEPTTHETLLTALDDLMGVTSLHTSATFSPTHAPDVLDEHEIEQICRLVTLLLDAGFSMDAQDHMGASVWDYLCRGPYAGVFQHALNYAITRNQVPKFDKLITKNGQTLAHTCALFGQRDQLQQAMPYFSLGGLNLKTRGKLVIGKAQGLLVDGGFTALSIAILSDQWPIAKMLIVRGCRLDRTTRDPTHKRSLKKGDNVLHLLASRKSALPDEATELFKKISAAVPNLLMQPNASGAFVIETLVANSHLSLLPITCSRMKKTKLATAALNRASALAQAQLAQVSSPTSHHTTHPLWTPSNLHTQTLVFTCGLLTEELSKAWSSSTLGLFASLNSSYEPPTIDILKTRALTVIHDAAPATSK